MISSQTNHSSGGREKILITGGAGFIGSHCALELINFGFDVTIIDNLENSDEMVFDRISRITGSEVKFFVGDIRDRSFVEKIFESNTFDSVIHFAGKKSVSDSILDPLDYFENNVSGTLNVLSQVEKHRISKFIFSSSATVYSSYAPLPVNEFSSTDGIDTPYGRSKYFVEEILRDLVRANDWLSVGILRYFNPAGAHKTGLLGEDPRNPPSNLVPIVTEAALRMRDFVSVFGNDYDTHDGTGVRDYIHVVDLAKGHLAALNGLNRFSGYNIWNLGTGRGASVLDIVNAFNVLVGHEIDVRILPRREGDRAFSYADVSKSLGELKWSAELTLSDIAEDALRWRKNKCAEATSDE